MTAALLPPRRPLRRAALSACLAALAGAPLPAQQPDLTLISCPVSAERRLELSLDPGPTPDKGGFRYAFGPAGSPDLRLFAPFSAGPVRPWNGVGRSIWSSVTFANGAYSYEVWHSLDRLAPEPRPQAGVNVLKGETLLAAHACLDAPSTRIAPVFAFEDAMQDAGQAYDRQTGRWRPLAD